MTGSLGEGYASELHMATVMSLMSNYPTILINRWREVGSPRLARVHGRRTNTTSMDKDPAQTLMAQFSNFLVGKNIDHQDWEMVTTEYGVHKIATKQERFLRSWMWGDDDRSYRTVRFLKVLYDRDEETALALMKRVYDHVDGADGEELQKYPALQSLEGERTDIAGGLPTLTVTTDLFIDIDNTTDDFYDDLIENINQCYRIGVYDGTFVLTRKLLENLVLDLLRKEYPKSYLQMYYIPNERRFRNFSTLLDVFEYRLKDYQSYSDGLNSDLIADIRRFKNTANSDAHSVVRNPDKDDIDDLGDSAEYASKVLFRAFRSMD